VLLMMMMVVVVMVLRTEATRVQINAAQSVA
jgi:hypothetical protein